MNALALALRSLMREWRSGELGVLLLALSTAVAALTGVGFLVDRIGIAVDAQATEVLAADLRLGSTRPIPGAYLSEAARRGVQTASMASLLSVVFFGDASATMYALNAQTGALIWNIRPVDHFASTITGTARYYKGVVYQPIASFEEALGGDPKAQCCTFRGSVVALDAATCK